MSHMQLFIYQKGALYAADCSKCGMTMYTHEWTTDDHNDRRDAMQAGTARCDGCGSAIDKDTFVDCGKQYAGRYSAPGYMDCTDWSYGRNKRTLEHELRDMYGDES
jgi:NAD-dependent SIR2 family protein deacetylase